MLPAGDHRDAKLRVFDAQGRAVRHFDRAFVPGRNEVVWDGSNDQGASLPAGIYFYRLDVMAEALTHKMVLVR
jgi:flagellar hook assembly protein FlgD